MLFVTKFHTENSSQISHLCRLFFLQYSFSRHLRFMITAEDRNKDLLQCISAHLQNTLPWRLETQNTSIFLVLIFVPAWSHAVENRSKACGRPCWDDPRMQHQFVRKKQTVYPAVSNSDTHVDMSDCLPNSYRPALSKHFGREPHKLLHNSSRAGHLA